MRAPRISSAGSCGFTRFELMVVVAILAAVTAILLGRLHNYQEAAERADMEYVISAVKSGLRLRIAEKLVQGRVQELPSLAAENPIDWLDVKPANYGGLLSNASSKTGRPGNWYFDKQNRQLIYLARAGSRLQADSTGEKRIRLAVQVKHPELAMAGESKVDSMASVTIVPVEPYRW